MAGEAPKLTVVYSALATAALDEIWEWNADRYGPDHADQYVGFLRRETDKLVEFHSMCGQVPSRPRFQYTLIKRRRRGYGHLAVFEVVDEEIRVLCFYHTAQNWQSQF